MIECPECSAPDRCDDGCFKCLEWRTKQLESSSPLFEIHSPLHGVFSSSLFEVYRHSYTRVFTTSVRSVTATAALSPYKKLNKCKLRQANRSQKNETRLRTNYTTELNLLVVISMCAAVMRKLAKRGSLSGVCACSALLNSTGHASDLRICLERLLPMQIPKTGWFLMRPVR